MCEGCKLIAQVKVTVRSGVSHSCVVEHSHNFPFCVFLALLSVFLSFGC